VVALVIVGIILFALTLDYTLDNLTRLLAARAERASASSRLPACLAARIPLGVALDPAHVWVHREKDQLVRVGSDGFATALLGKPESVKLLAKPGPIARGAPLAVFAREGRSLTLRSPIGGALIECNAGLSPEDAFADPFGRGWLANIRSSDPAPAKGMLDVKHAQGFLTSEWNRLRDFVVSSMRAKAPAGATMADGGALQSGFLARLSASDCQAVERSFFAVASDESVSDGTTRREVRQ
jgi:glycine cleavage system H lipoate-binding protein